MRYVKKLIASTMVLGVLAVTGCTSKADVASNNLSKAADSGAVVNSLRRLHSLGWELPKEFRNAVTDAVTTG